MLNHLHIRNLAVVDEVEVELGAGLTVLTGETGAGKSILIDALGLALGERADSDAVRPGAKRAEISATFSIPADNAALIWLSDNDLDEDSDCILRRVVTAEGRSSGYINGNPVPMQKLRELGALLVDICGQQAHQSLTKTDNQRTLLDQHGKLTTLVAEHRAAFSCWQTAQRAFQTLENTSNDQANRLDLLRFQVQELDALDAKPGELEQLERAHRLAANLSRIQESAGAALQLLYENEQASGYDLVARARGQLEDLAELDSEFTALVTMLTEAEIQITEAADALRHYLDQEAPDENNLPQLESRLAAMHELARKHRVAVSALPELAAQLRVDLDNIEHADDRLEELRLQVAAHHSTLTAVGSKLTKARNKAAKSLATEVSAHMQQLGMPDGTFRINFTPLDKPAMNGAERIEFYVAINPGMPAGPLLKVASGGELSRVSLAIQVAASDRTNTPTMIFDEVDAGVGGRTADIVGEKLRGLAGSCQVMCVTHLPQVASKGHAQFRVSKLSDGHNTRTRITSLSADERVDELARMLGGAEITQRTREHAAEMLTIGNAQ